MKSEARKLLRELVDAWKDFDIAMKAMASGNLIASEEEHFNRLTKASERFQKAIADSESFLGRH